VWVCVCVCVCVCVQGAPVAEGGRRAAAPPSGVLERERVCVCVCVCVCRLLRWLRHGDEPPLLPPVCYWYAALCGELVCE